MSDHTMRQPYETARQLADTFCAELAAANPGLDFYLGGSLRRQAPTVADLDVVCVTADGTLEAVILPPSITQRGSRIAHGTTVAGAMPVDVWACTRRELGAFLCFVTGPKALNVAQRAYARAQGLRLSQTGLWRGDVQVDDGTEADVYRQLGWPWLSTTQREDWQQAAADVPVTSWPVRGSRGDTYTVSLRAGQVTCTCPGFRYRKVCRHVREA